MLGWCGLSLCGHPPPRPSTREPSNPVSPWGLGLGLRVGGGGHLGACEEPQDRKGSLVWA